jgi:uncharacterized protein YdhG (YjbR/CyaY superfamily)
MIKAKSVAAFYKALPKTHAPALKKLRAQIQKLYPTAVEQISYGMPLFKLDGKPLGGVQAAKNHSAIFVWSGTALRPLKKMLADYDTSIGTVRFPPHKPPPLKVVKAILASREKEIRKSLGKKK